MADQWRDTLFGLARRTGPTTLEIFDPITGKAYAMNLAEFEVIIEPRHELDQLFLGGHPVGGDET